MLLLSTVFFNGSVRYISLRGLLKSTEHLDIQGHRETVGKFQKIIFKRPLLMKKDFLMLF